MADQGLINLFMTRYEPVLKMALQQKTSLLRAHVNESVIKGAKMASPLNLLGATNIKQRVGRFQPKANTPANFTRRWVQPIDYEEDQYIDEFDLLKTTIDPKSEMVQNLAASFGREVDDAIIVAATAGAQIGADAGSLSSESFTVAGTGPNTTSIYQVLGSFGGSSTTGLTVAKINEARRILEHNHNTEELMAGDGVMIIGSQQHADLRNQALVTSAEFNRAGGVLEKGYVTDYMGFKIVVSERLPIITDAASNTTQRGCLVFVKSGIHLGVWQDLKTEVFRRGDLSGNPYDINVMAAYGATRTQLGKVIQVCAFDNTQASDITV